MEFLEKFDKFKNTLMSFRNSEDEYEDEEETADEEELEETEDAEDETEEDDSTDDENDEEEQSVFSPSVISKKAGFGGYKRKVVNFEDRSGSNTAARKKEEKMLSRSLTNMQEAKDAAMALMNGTTLLVTFDVSDDEKTKLFHFLIGVTYAIDASFDKIQNGVFVFYPRGVVLEGDMKERGSEYLK